MVIYLLVVLSYGGYNQGNASFYEFSNQTACEFAAAEIKEMNKNNVQTKCLKVIK